MKPSGIGGQAVIEGVMMKNKERYAIAVRKPDNEIVVETNTFASAADKYKIFKLPIFRGMLAFVESMIIGTRTLTFSASFFEEEEEVKQTKLDKAFSKIFKDKAESIIMTVTFIVAILLAVGIFIVLPAFVAGLLGERIESGALLAVVEGCIRILIFISYVLAISQMKDIKRMFMYHGAEHKTINCLEQGFELTVENVKWQSKQHKRCGTSFMFIVMFVSILFFIFIRMEQEWLRYLVRILLIPVIAGVSYEFIRLAGKSDSKIVHVLSQPGMWLQGLTTREPDEDMIEVAIRSVDAVFDWRAFLEPAQEKQNGRKSRRNKNGGKNSGKNHNLGNKTKKSDSRNNAVSKDKPAQNGNTEINGKPDGNQTNGQEAVKTDITDIKTGKSNRRKNRAPGSGLKQENPSANTLQTAMEETAATSEKAANIPVQSVLEDEDDEILRALDRYLVEAEENEDKDK